MKNAEQQNVTQFISTGYPPLDHALASSYKEGGVPSGRIIEMFGPPSAGKTAISTNIMANAQKAGGFAGFQDHENSFDAELGASFGLSLDPDNWVYNKPDTFEQSFEQVIDSMLLARGMAFYKGRVVYDAGKVYFPKEKPVVFVFDSLASMVPQSTIVDSKGKTKEASDRNMNDNTALARATSAHFPTMAMIAERTNATLIFLNQVRTKMGVMYGDPTTTPGGGAPEFYASVRIKLGRSLIVDEKTKEKKGQAIGAEIIKNKVRAPFKKASWEFQFQEDGTGKFDIVGGCIDELKELGILKTSGAYIEWIDGKKYYKSQLVPHIEQNGQQAELMALFPG